MKQLDRQKLLSSISVSVNIDTEYCGEQTLKEVFESEYRYGIAREGFYKALKSWLRGLPSALAFPFSNYDVVNTLGYDWDSLSDDECIGLVEAYWQDLLPCVVYKMME